MVISRRLRLFELNYPSSFVIESFLNGQNIFLNEDRICRLAITLNI